MNKKLFKEVIEKIKLLNFQIYEYYKFGIDLHESQHPVAETAYSVIDLLLYDVFTKEQTDVMMWFMYENDFGECGLKYDDVEINTIDDLYKVITNES